MAPVAFSCPTPRRREPAFRTRLLEVAERGRGASAGFLRLLFERNPVLEPADFQPSIRRSQLGSAKVAPPGNKRAYAPAEIRVSPVISLLIFTDYTALLALSTDAGNDAILEVLPVCLSIPVACKPVRGARINLGVHGLKGWCRPALGRDTQGGLGAVTDRGHWDLGSHEADPILRSLVAEQAREACACAEAIAAHMDDLRQSGRMPWAPALLTECIDTRGAKGAALEAYLQDMAVYLAILLDEQPAIAITLSRQEALQLEPINVPDVSVGALFGRLEPRHFHLRRPLERAVIACLRAAESPVDFDKIFRFDQPRRRKLAPRRAYCSDTIGATVERIRPSNHRKLALMARFARLHEPLPM